MSADLGPLQTNADVVPGRSITFAEVYDLEDVLTGVARREPNTLQQTPMFIYMDVGRWGGESRQFGLIYGDGTNSEALLCQYEPEHNDLPCWASFDEIKWLIAHGDFEGRIRCLKRIWLPELGLNTQGTLYVLLGDLHLPLLGLGATVSDVAQIRRRLTGTAIAVADELIPDLGDSVSEDIVAATGWLFRPFPLQLTQMLLASGRAACKAVLMDEMTDERWIALYQRGNIFEPPGFDLAGYYLITFLDGLAKFCRDSFTWCSRWKRPAIHLIQLGDMYEQWIGLERLFVKDASEVALEEPAGAAIADVRQWIATTNQASGRGLLDGRTVLLTDTLHQCKVDGVTWIRGNHDNYLSVLSRGGVAPLPTDPPVRVRGFLRHGLHVEHGHACDTFNRDGATMGHLITQLAFLRGGIRHWEPARRNGFLTHAVYRFLEARRGGQELKVFAMAHTHAAYLTEIHVRGGSDSRIAAGVPEERGFPRVAGNI